MEMTQRISQALTRTPNTDTAATNALANHGLAGWVVGALQGRVRIKWKTGTASTRTQTQMELLDTLSLGGKRQVMLIECRGERYLVGCGPDAVATIEKVTAETRPAAVKAVAQTWL